MSAAAPEVCMLMLGAGRGLRLAAGVQRTHWPLWGFFACDNRTGRRYGVLKTACGRVVRSPA
jgi:hypothetical protein